MAAKVKKKSLSKLKVSALDFDDSKDGWERNRKGSKSGSGSEKGSRSNKSDYDANNTVRSTTANSTRTASGRKTSYYSSDTADYVRHPKYSSAWESEADAGKRLADGWGSSSPRRTVDVQKSSASSLTRVLDLATVTPKDLMQLAKMLPSMGPTHTFTILLAQHGALLVGGTDEADLENNSPILQNQKILFPAMCSLLAVVPLSKVRSLVLTGIPLSIGILDSISGIAEPAKVAGSNIQRGSCCCVDYHNIVPPFSPLVSSYDSLVGTTL